MPLHCLSEDILHQMTEGRLPEPALSLSLIHLDECNHCQSIFNEALRNVEKAFVSPLAQSPDADKIPAELLKIPTLGTEAASSQNASETTPGFFSHFKVLSEINRGMDSRVLEALDPRLDRKVAIKILEREFTAEDAVLGQQFLDEARIVAQINHPAIVPIYDVGVFEQQPYIVMPLLNGENLRSRLQRGPIEPGEAVRLVNQLLEGLKAAHDFGVIHKDLKPENLWLKPGPDGRDDLIILDFGNAQQVNTVAASATGTPLYVAPEQAMRHHVDARTDFFSLGTVFFEMLTSEPAWSVEAEEKPASPSRDSRIPAPFAPVLERLLALEPENRYADHATLKQDLAKSLRKLEKTRNLKTIGLVSLGATLGIIFALNLNAPNKQDVKTTAANDAGGQLPIKALNNGRVPAITSESQAKAAIDLSQTFVKLREQLITPAYRYQLQPGSMLAVSQNGHALAKNKENGRFTVYDTSRSFEEIAQLDGTEASTRAWISPKGNFVAVLSPKASSQGRIVRVWRLENQTISEPIKQDWDVKTGESDLSDATWMDRDGISYLYLTSKNLEVLELKFPKEGKGPLTQSSLKHLYSNITRLYPQPGGNLLIGAKDSGGVDIFDTRRHVIQYAWRVFPQGAPAISWSPDPNFFIVTHNYTEIRYYDLRKTANNVVYTGFDYLIDEQYLKFAQKVVDATFINENELLLRTPDSRQYLSTYNIKTRSIIALIDTEGEPVDSFLVLKDSKFATIGRSGLVRVYNHVGNSSTKR